MSYLKNQKKHQFLLKQYFFADNDNGESWND